MRDRRRGRLGFAPWALALLVVCAAGGGAIAEERPNGAEALRIGTSGDYAPFSTRGPDGALSGLDVEIARAFAASVGAEIVWVPFTWPELADDLRAGRFDLALSGVTVRADRARIGTYSVPLLASGAVALVPGVSPLETVADLDESGVRIAVNAGGHLERVARRAFPKAQVIPVPDNGAVLSTLESGEADAVVTDTLEAPHWRARRPGLRATDAFTRDRKAALAAPGSEAWLAAFDAWALEAERSGELERLRAAALGPGAAGPATATPLGALGAAIDLRLSLMPAVAEAKRASGAPVRVPEREVIVLDAAARGVAEAAAARGVAAPDDAAVRALFTALIAAARDIQESTLAGEAAPGPPPDLDGDLRPALLRIGDRIAELLTRLPPGLEPTEVAEGVAVALADRGLGPDRQAEIVAGIVGVARP